MATAVLVPGAGGASSYWHLVAAELRGRGTASLVSARLPVSLLVLVNAGDGGGDPRRSAARPRESDPLTDSLESYLAEL
jgi:hypothetical protein